MVISNTDRKCQFTNCAKINILRPICQIIPEMPDIPDQHGNIALMPLLPVLHEDRVKTLLSQQVNKLTRCYYAMSML